MEKAMADLLDRSLRYRPGEQFHRAGPHPLERDRLALVQGSAAIATLRVDPASR